MHRLSLFVVLTSLTSLAACGGGQAPPATQDKTKSEPVEGKDGETADHADAGGAAGEKAAEKRDVCVGFDIANLEDLLSKSDCEVPNAKPGTLQNPEMKGKLEVTVTASPTKVAPGAKADLQVNFTNKTKEPMTLYFRIDPVSRFETETYDASKKRADMPTSNPPPPPKGHSAPPAAEAKVAKVTIAANGFARVLVPWEASKMKWAPEKVRGTAVEKGYPRVPAGPLAKGKYTVKVLTPLVGVFEGSEHEVSGPKLEIEVGS